MNSLPVSVSPLTPAPLARRALLALAWLALVVVFYVPVSQVMDISLDASNYASYSLFTAQGYDYGRQVIPMVGPYGFITYGHTYGGELFWARAALALTVNGALAALILWFLHAAAAARVGRWLWLAALGVFSVTIDDFPIEWTVLLAGLHLLLAPASARGRDAALAALLALLALIKGTQVSLALATLGLVAAQRIVTRRDYAGVAWLVGAFFLSLGGWWLAAGQNLLHLPSFLRGVGHLTAGYNQAMGLQEASDMFGRGLATALLLGSAITWSLWHCRRRPTAVAGLLLLLGFSFVKWKHGFVRADGHVFIFYQYASIAPLAWYAWCVAAAPEEFRSRLVRGVAGAWAALVFIASVYGAGDAAWPRFRWALGEFPRLVAQRAQQLADLPGTKRTLDTQLEQQRQTYALPRLREIIGRGSVDLFGTEHGIIPLNRLRYTPRPMGGGAFNVFDSYLQQRNADFVGGAQRPDFFLLKLATIDNRFPAQDDAQALYQLLQHYEPVDAELGFILLRNRRLPTAAPTPQVIETRRFRFGDVVRVPQVGPDEMLLASFSVPPSWRGRLRTFLYKPTLVFANFDAHQLAEPESRRLVPLMTTDPVVMSPMIEDTGDVLRLFSAAQGKPLFSFRLATETPADFAADLSVTFYRAPRPAAPRAVDIEELVSFTRFPLANVMPESITPPDARRLSIANLPAQQLMPPASMVWKLDGTEREFLFDFGLDPVTYDKNAGNGTVFHVDLRQPGLADVPLFTRLVAPAQRPDDRRNLSARIVLPPYKNGSRLVLRTEPGEFNDNAWDWAYVTRIQIKRGAYSEKQFPRFSRLPDSADVSYSMIIDDEDAQKLLILHAPGSVTFRLNGTERELAFDYGFRPGAYTNDGQTDGARYWVELSRPNEPVQVLFQRWLRPRSVAADQGRQHAQIPLPALGPADKLTLRIDPGPDNNNAWDWTYVTNLQLR